MEQNDLFSEETPGVASPEATLSGSQTIPDPEPDATTESAAEEVVGIDRQKTEDLIALLGSVRAKVASAAIYELERRGMTATQLEIAVDLARGNSEARLGALERLIHQEEFDPTPWLGWIAADRDRDVRYRAVSILGSLNSNSSRTKLRLLLARERDEEITRHIQQILLSGTNTSTARSSSQRTNRP
jgi:HEAT repeat protein